MKIEKGKTYKLIETGGFLLVVDPTTPNIGMFDQIPGQQPLIVADHEDLLKYLAAYFHQRSAGKTLREAHQLAMEYVGAKLIQ